MHLLSSTDRALVQASFRKLNRNADAAAHLFFARLFQFEPSLRTRITADSEQRKRALIRLLGTIVHRLDCIELLRDHLAELSLQNPELCEREEHHHALGAALFWMLEQVLGTSFTPAVYAAWMSVFRALSHDMKAMRELPLAS